MQKTFLAFLCSIMIVMSHTHTIQSAPTVSSKELLFDVTVITFVGFCLGIQSMREVYKEQELKLEKSLRKQAAITAILKKFTGKELDKGIVRIRDDANLFYEVCTNFDQRELNKQLCPHCPTSYSLVTKVLGCSLSVHTNKMKERSKQAKKRMEEL